MNVDHQKMMRSLESALAAKSRENSKFYRQMLDEFVALSGSEYGFIGEVFHNAKGVPHVHLYAMSDICWDQQSTEMYKQVNSGGLKFHNLDTLFGAVVTSAVPVITNHAESDDRNLAMPAGHPAVRNFLGLPIHGDQDLLGIVCLANREDGFSRQQVRDLNPLVTLVAYMIEQGRQQDWQQNAYEAWNQSEKRYQELVEHFPGAVYRSALTGYVRIYDVSKQIENICGFGVDDIVGDGGDLFYSRILDEDRQSILDSLNDAVLTGSMYSLEYRIKDKEDKIRWIQDKGRAVYNETGDLRYLCGSLTDCTQQKFHEQERSNMHERFMQAQHMQTIGQMAGGIAHDFNNILASVMGYAELCTEMIDAGEYENMSTYLKQIILSGERARDIIASMLMFSRGTEGGAKPLDIRDMFGEMDKVLYVALPKTVDIRLNAEPDLLPVLFDSVEMQQIMVNTSLNASEAMDGYGVLDIKAVRVSVGRQVCASCHEVFSGDFIELRISDTGKGIDEQNRKRLFDPFFTTKPPGGGAGMGLSVVHGLVHKHGGHIQVHSQPGEGTEIVFYLSLQECTAHSTDHQNIA